MDKVEEYIKERLNTLRGELKGKNGADLTECIARIIELEGVLKVINTRLDGCNEVEMDQK